MQRRRHRIAGLRTAYRHPRHGGWLAQMVIVMSALSVLTSIAGVTLYRMFHMQNKMIHTVACGNSFEHMQRLFREDVHQANVASIHAVGEKRVLKLEQHDGEVLWSISGEMLRRTERPAGDETDPQKLPGEQFRFPDSLLSFETPDGASLVRLVVHTGAISDSEPKTQTKHGSARIVDAVLQLEAQYATPVEEAAR